MAMLFLFSAVLQLNDPDPAAWILLYASAAALAMLAAAGRQPGWRRPVALALAISALVWAIAIASSIPASPPWRAVFGDWGMHGGGVEAGREALGLLFVSLYAAWVAGYRSPSAASRRGE